MFDFQQNPSHKCSPLNAEVGGLPVGRTGRARLQGRASTLAAGAEVLELRQIERTLKLNMERPQTDTETTAPPRE